MDFFSELRRYLDVNHTVVVDALIEHIWLALLPVAIAFVLSLPLGWVVVRFGWARTPLLTVSSIVYTIPSLAMLLLMPSVLGTSVLDPLNVVVALALYSLALLVRTTSDALSAIDDGVVQAATAMGYKPARRWFAVELPLAMPVVLAGLRVATVANVSLVSVAALIGIGGLGQLFTRGQQLVYLPPIAVGLVLSVALAFALDALIVLAGRLLSPWDRIGTSR
jgi:osmoprotectant transport system permease protein